MPPFGYQNTSEDAIRWAINQGYNPEIVQQVVRELYGGRGRDSPAGYTQPGQRLPIGPNDRLVINPIANQQAMYRLAPDTRWRKQVYEEGLRQGPGGRWYQTTPKEQILSEILGPKQEREQRFRNALGIPEPQPIPQYSSLDALRGWTPQDDAAFDRRAVLARGGYVGQTPWERAQSAERMKTSSGFGQYPRAYEPERQAPAWWEDPRFKNMGSLAELFSGQMEMGDIF